MDEKINKEMANKIKSSKASPERHLNCCYLHPQVVGPRLASEKRKQRSCDRNMAAVIKKSQPAGVAAVERAEMRLCS